MDAISQFLLTENFDVVFAVLGNASTGRHMLVPVGEGSPLSEGENLKARIGGYEFAGVFGFRHSDRFADLKCEDAPNSHRIMLCATPTFLVFLTGLSKPVDDSASWLQRLWELPDTRLEN